MKKYVKYIVIPLIIILAICLIWLLRNFFILKGLDKKINEANYYMKVTSYNGSSISSVETYVKGTKSIIKSADNIIIYEDNQNKKMIYNVNGTNQVITSADKIPNITISPSSKILANPNLGTAISVKISSERCNGKDCYVIDNYKGVRVWIEKETGLMVRAMNGISHNNNNQEFNTVTDYTYSFGTVTDSDVSDPEN